MGKVFSLQYSPESSYVGYLLQFKNTELVQLLMDWIATTLSFDQSQALLISLFGIGIGFETTVNASKIILYTSLSYLTCALFKADGGHHQWRWSEH